MTERVPPQNIEAEQSVLGAVFLENEALDHALEHLTDQDFYRESHRRIFRAMIELSERSEPIDAITLSNALKVKGQLEEVGGSGYIAELADCVPTASHVVHYARIVRSRSVLRSLATTATEISSRAFENPEDVTEFVVESEAAIHAIVDREIRSEDTKSLAVLSAEARDLILANDGRLTGVETGFYDFDYATGGLQKKELNIIAARPGMGKTALALNIAHNIAAKGTAVAFFTLEMSGLQLSMRMLCGVAEIDSVRARTGQLTPGERAKIPATQAEIATLPIEVDDDSSLSPARLKAKCRRINRKYKGKLGLVIVDYLQLMRPARQRENRQQEVAEVSRALKRLAKELNVPVLALCQMNRAIERGEARAPVLADLRESGQIEQDADLIAFLVREQNMDNADTSSAKLYIRKQRNGAERTIDLMYSNRYTRFHSGSKDDYADVPEAQGSQDVEI